MRFVIIGVILVAAALGVFETTRHNVPSEAPVTVTPPPSASRPVATQAAPTPYAGTGYPAEPRLTAPAIAQRPQPLTAAPRMAAPYIPPAPPPVYAAPATVIIVRQAPPPLPVYVVPPPPAQGYIWTPGHWRWVGYYFWVPGTWVRPPAVGVLWTPGYWGWQGGSFAWHEGYWAPHVGFYGGINYGGGYSAAGFIGGSWHGSTYVHNPAVVNVSTAVNVTRVTNVRNITSITNVRNVTNVTNVTTSFNGGPGGVAAAPTPEQRQAEAERHLPPTAEQTEHLEAARNMPALRASANGGKPAVAATAKPAEFSGKGVVAASQAGRANPETEKYNATAAHENLHENRLLAAEKPAQKPTPAVEHKPEQTPEAGKPKLNPKPQAHKPEEHRPEAEKDKKPEEKKPEEKKPEEQP